MAKTKLAAEVEARSNIRFPRRVFAAVQKEAARRYMTVPGLIRLIVTEWLETKGLLE